MNDFCLVAEVPAPHFVAMEDRAARLEEDVRDVTSVLSRLEPMIIRIDATLTSTLPHLATKADLAELRSVTRTEVSALGAGLRAEMSEIRGEAAEFRVDMRDRLGTLHEKLGNFPTKIYLGVSWVS
ncbi:MAG TPA: hypothetical protein DDZ81_05395 [Acetobacteraceae bacterium]|nr:hypothetical protein [Acetobacteraceae bacterium]